MQDLPDCLKSLPLFIPKEGEAIHDVVQEVESKEYGAFDFRYHQYRIKFRIGKITPTKIGQFTTLWKRIGKGPIMPFDEEDPFDFLIIRTQSANQSGQFIFPKALLCEKGIVSSKQKGEGKRAMRIYPPWDITNNKQAQKTQSWQVPYFFLYTK
jgi:hypothetical protein